MKSGNLNTKTIIKFIIFLIVILGIIYFVNYYGLKDYLTPNKIRETVLMFGPLAPLGFILIYNLGSILFLPGTILSVAGGAIFGATFGTIYVIIGATLGATFAFLISRYFARSFFEDIVEKKYPKIKEYDEKLERNGFMTVLFFRLIPLFPFNGLNFALGLTKVKLRDYFLATLIGIIPGTFAYVYLGSSLVEMNYKNIIFAIVLIILLSLSLKAYNSRKK
jgi:uncharacterized membrane protein YdjX (TVP38/TMEM64 family)